MYYYLIPQILTPFVSSVEPNTVGCEDSKTFVEFLVSYILTTMF